MNTSSPRPGRIRSASLAVVCGLALMSPAFAAPAAGAEIEITREQRDVVNSGTFTTCADGSTVSYWSVSHRDYTTWYRDGVAVREHRHITFEGTLQRGETTVPYTGVWNRDQNLVTGELRITGGQFRVDLPTGGTLVGAGVRAEGNEFKATGDRFLTDLCAALGA